MKGPLPIVLMLTLAGSLAGCASADPPAVASSPVSGMTATSTVAPQDRGAPLTLSGQDLDGARLDIAAYRGKVVVLNIWGSWCGPCRGEAAGLEAVYKADRAKGVQLVGINTRDLDMSSANAFVRSASLTYPNLFDPQGSLLLHFPAGSINPQTIPSTLILDRQGRVAVRALQPVTQTQLESLLNPVLQENF